MVMNMDVAMQFKECMRVHVFFYKHSVFQSEARICLSFSQSLKLCLKYAYLRTFKEDNFMFYSRLGEGVGRGYQNEEILKCVPSRLLKSLTEDNN